MSMLLPRNVGGCFEISKTPERAYGIADIANAVHCTVTPAGGYTVTGEDPQIIFAVDPSAEIDCVRINAVSKLNKSVTLELYTATEKQPFSTEKSYISSLLAGRQETVINIPRGNYTSLRVDIDGDVIFKSLEIFDEQPTLVPYQPDYSALDYFLTAAIPILLAALVYFLNQKIGFFERLVGCISRNRLKIITVSVFAAVALLLAVLVELIIGLALGGTAFNAYRWLFIAGVFELAVAFTFGFKCLNDKPERLFLPIILILGTVMTFASPVKLICWDLDSHYQWSVGMSYLDEYYITEAELQVDRNGPLMHYEGMDNYENNISRLKELDKQIVTHGKTSLSVAHLPSAIFIAVSRFLGGDFVTRYNMGRFANLLVYAVVCYFAIKKLKSGKMILAVIALFPTALFLATNYAYDWWVTAFTMLGTAYFVGELQQPKKPMTVGDALIMSAAFALGALPKLIYVVLMGMLVFMRKDRFEKAQRRRYYLVILSVCALLCVMLAAKTLLMVGSAGDARGGDVNPSAQLVGILSNPIGYAKMLTGFLKTYLSVGGMREYISHFAYLGLGNAWVVAVVLLAFVTLTDSNREAAFKIPIYMRALAVLLFVGMAALIATALYISFTPVALPTINGCQPRYIIPLLAPLLLLIGGQRLQVIKNKAVYNGVALGISSAVVLWDTYSVIISKML